VCLTWQDLAIMPGGKLGGPAFFNPLPPNHGSMRCYLASATPEVIATGAHIPGAKFAGDPTLPPGLTFELCRIRPEAGRATDRR
jgi:hypothetical protein